MPQDLLEKIYVELGERALTRKLNKYKNQRTLFIKAERGDFARFLERLESILHEYKGRSEIIKMLIKEGYFLDTGIETLKIEYGVMWEVYDYTSYSLYLIRLLMIKGDEGVWTAVYVDYNPDTAWWSSEERSC